MLSANYLKDVGDLVGVVYTFENEGDILPKHSHTEVSAHITIVCSGRIKAYSHDWEIEAVPGQVLNFLANQPHEFKALEPNTKIVNIVKTHNGDNEQVDL